MIAALARIVREVRAQDLAEYAIALSVIAAGTGIIAVALGAAIPALWANAQTELAATVAAL